VLSFSLTSGGLESGTVIGLLWNENLIGGAAVEVTWGGYIVM